MMRLPMILALLLVPLPARAKDAMQAQVEAVLKEAGPGTRWGMVVTDLDGTEIVAINPEGRFVPASNTKLFTTAAAFWTYSALELDEPDQAARTSAYLIPQGKRPPDVVLIGRGDARLSSAKDCKIDCLATLADAIAAKTRKVGNVVGDDSAFEDQRWSPGMSWNNIQNDDGTGVSALSLDKNEAEMRVVPAAKAALPAVPVVSPYFSLTNLAQTSDGPASTITFVRMPGSRAVTVMGTIPVTVAEKKLALGIDDPADYTAWTFAAMLRARGVKVFGKAGKQAAGSVDVATAAALAFAMAADDQPVLLPPPLIEDLSIINKQSQNLHAELLLRRIGARSGGLGARGSIEGGQKVITAMLTQAGLTPHQFSFSDGSGMSTYNRVASRGVVTFLRWTRAQPWGARFQATLPIGGTDGTLSRRFKGTALEGRIFAKTGTLNATNALAGYFTGASGKTLIFAAYANDVPDDVRATAVMDKALLLLAGAN